MKGLDRQVVKTLGSKNFGVLQILMSFLKNKTAAKLNIFVTFVQPKLSTITKILLILFKA